MLKIEIYFQFLVSSYYKSIEDNHWVKWSLKNNRLTTLAIFQARSMGVTERVTQVKLHLEIP